MDQPGALLRFALEQCRTRDRTGEIKRIPNWRFVHNYLNAFESGDDLHVEKTRQMLATWMGCAAMLWSLLFRPNFSGFVSSRKEKAVDDGGENSTSESLMGRIRFLYENLVDEQIRADFPVEFSYLRIRCETSGASIIGEAANGEIGRGGSFGNALVDEAAFLERSEQSHRSIRLACPRGLIYQSTPNGTGNAFARIKFEDPGSFNFLTFHWTHHPDRWNRLERDPETGKPTSPYYRWCQANMAPDQLAREVDIDYSASVSGLVYREFIPLEYPMGHIDSNLVWSRDLPSYWGLDFGIGAATAGWFAQVHINAHGYGELHVLTDYELENQPVSVHARNLYAKALEAGFRPDPTLGDSTKQLRRQIKCFGDPAGNAREMVRASTVVQAYKLEGYDRFHTPHKSIKDGIRLIQRLFHQKRIRIHPRCMVTLKRIPNYAYPTDDAGNVMGDEPVKTGPSGNSSHVMDGARYLATGLFPVDDRAAESAPAGLGQEAPLASENVKDILKPEDAGDWRPMIRLDRGGW